MSKKLDCSCASYCSRVEERVSHKKPFSRQTAKTQLNRCLSTLDLIGYGIAAMIGSSIFILTGTVMRNRAGPATFLAYIIAGVVALPNSLAYSDLACRIPKAGSVYVYTYVIINELIAFFAGWSVLLEYIIGTGAVARGCSGMIDVMTQGKMGEVLVKAFGKLNESSHVLAPYLDPFGALLIVIVAVISCFGIKSSALFTNLLVGLNLLVVTIVTVFMFVYADFQNLSAKPPSNYTYTDPLSNLRVDPDSPSWLPFGLPGLIAGAATCFNAFIGFDVISTCAEETEHPGKSLPRANIFSVLIVTLILSLCAFSLALYEPWFLLSPDAPFHSALMLSMKGEYSARMGMFFFVGIGAIIGLVSCLLGNMIAASRILYGMAEDRLVFSLFNTVCEPFKSPIFATLLVTIVALVLDLIFSIESLADFLSLGTLFAYSLASVAVLKYRYCDPLDQEDGPEFTNADLTRIDSKSTVGLKGSDDEHESLTDNSRLSHNLSPFWTKHLPRHLTWVLGQGFPRGTIPMIALALYILFSACLILTVSIRDAGFLAYWSLPRILFGCIFILLMIICIFTIAIHRQKVTNDPDLYQLPLVPVLPCISLLLNITLISQLTWLTWVRFILWLLMGCLVYFGYGVFQDRPEKDFHKLTREQEIESSSEPNSGKTSKKDSSDSDM